MAANWQQQSFWDLLAWPQKFLAVAQIGNFSDKNLELLKMACIHQNMYPPYVFGSSWPAGFAGASKKGLKKVPE